MFLDIILVDVLLWQTLVFSRTFASSAEATSHPRY